jgi:hypothetical protein
MRGLAAPFFFFSPLSAARPLIDPIRGRMPAIPHEPPARKLIRAPILRNGAPPRAMAPQYSGTAHSRPTTPAFRGLRRDHAD